LIVDDEEVISAETACVKIKRCKGAQFDPGVADAFLKTGGPQNQSFNVSITGMGVKSGSE